MSSRNFPLPLPPPPSADQKEPHHGLSKPEEDNEWYREADCFSDHYSQVGPSHSDKGYPCVDPMETELVKPNLPPKPPPAYREPPDDNVRRRLATTNQPPDLCPRTSSNFSTPVSSSACASASIPLKPIPKPEKQDSIPTTKQGAAGTQAWVQEPKPSGKLVGERLSSLQRKLRSLLTQTQPSVVKDTFSTKGLHTYREDHNESQAPAASSANVRDTRPNLMQAPAPPQQNTFSSNEQRSTTSIQASSSGFASGYSYGQEFGYSLPERHPFESTVNHDESEDPDTSHIRDTCNRLFSSNDPKGTWTAYRSPRSSYSNNIKSAYDYDKLVPKEVIGKPCQEKKPAETYTHVHSSYQSSNSFPSLVSNSDQHQEMYNKTEPKNTLYLETQYYSLKDVYNVPEVDASNENPSRRNRYYHRKFSSRNRDFSDGTTNSTKGDCGDVSDQYKSSSESGHGTMQSSTKDSKSLISAPSSGISAASNLDTSLDSDHSANCTLWDNPQSRDWTQKSPSSGDKRQFNDNQGQQDYTATDHAEKSNEETDNDGPKPNVDHVYSESLSGTPPLPPLSPPPSSYLSESSSPRASPKAKYKLSLSTSALNSHQQTSHSDSPPKATECNSGKNKHRNEATSPNSKAQSGMKKNSARLVGASSRHWKCGPSPHQRSNTVGCNGGRKVRGTSPILRQLARIPPQPLGLSSYNEFADLELTSTTTGLDGESVDDQDDLSSELSVSTSTMDPMEVSMIRKQLEGLESMYSEILHLLGVKNSPCKAISRSGGNISGFPRNSRCRMNGSLSSLTARSSNSRGTHNLIEKRGISDKRRGKDGRNGSPSKRLQRLESHVVTLARSVAHLSSEMRTQHILVQELEHMRRDVSWVQERLRLMQLTQGCHGASGNTNANKVLSTPVHPNWEHFRKEVSELLNPNRAKKLTKFFGDEPPLIRQFLKRLGYEKYAPNFETEKIGIMELPYLTEERLHKIGIPMGPRIRILQEARAYCQQNQYKVYVL